MYASCMLPKQFIRPQPQQPTQLSRASLNPNGDHRAHIKIYVWSRNQVLLYCGGLRGVNLSPNQANCHPRADHSL